MNPLQGGLNSSQLVPQSFQNSFQSNTSGDNIGIGIRSSEIGQNLNTTEATDGSLQVVVRNPQNLTSSTQAVAAATTDAPKSGANWFVVTGLLLLATLFFVISFRLFKKSKKPQPQEQED